jgi:hypothetical protein
MLKNDVKELFGVNPKRVCGIIERFDDTNCY